MDDNGIVLPRNLSNLGRESRVMIRLNSISSSRNPSSADSPTPSPGSAAAMLRPHPTRRRSRYAPHLCAAAAVALLLLLLSLSLLHLRLSSSFPFSLRPDLPDSDPDLPDPTTAAAVALPDDPDHDDAEFDDDAEDLNPIRPHGSGYFWDHAAGVVRRSFGKSDRHPDDPLFDDSFADPEPDAAKVSFASDDQPMDEGVRAKLNYVRRIEDALLIKAGGGESPLREGWARWLEGKADFLRRDRMLRSNLESLHPRNHTLLQDPDMPGSTALTRGDKLMQRAIWKEMEQIPFPGSGEVKKVELRKALHLKEEEEEDGPRRRWGYYPGVERDSTFSQFMDRFLEGCSTRVFMVWNTPSWMFGVRQQRGLESLLYHNRDACVVVLSEMLELDFFKDFVKDGYKVAVAMPNLDELLKDTPAHIFASVWFDWRKTKYYSIHYSELVRLAVLYKYGGIYLDSDIIVLKTLPPLVNSVGTEDQMDGNTTFNGAVMAFKRNSPFLMECLEEFYSTYDDTNMRWNGAGLMTRVINRLRDKQDKSNGRLDLNIESPLAFFPISQASIIRYFSAAANDVERDEQDFLFRRIMNESMTFHFWNGLTSALVPEPNSLVERLLNQYCLHCLDVL